jgi:hypothetical protein
MPVLYSHLSRPVDTESVPEFITLAELHSLARRFGAHAALLGEAAAKMEALAGQEGVYAALAGMEEAAARHGVEELRGPLAARVEAVGVQEGSFSRLLKLSAGDGKRAEVREAVLH